MILVVLKFIVSLLNTLQTWETLTHDEDISVQSLNLFLLSSLMCQSLYLFGFTVSYSEKYELITPIKGPCENMESGPALVHSRGGCNAHSRECPFSLRKSGQRCYWESGMSL